jgi:hypothetical protein
MSEETQEQSTGVEIEIDGQKFLVTEEFKNALETQEKTLRVSIEEQMRQEQIDKNSRTVEEEKPVDLTSVDSDKMTEEITKKVREQIKKEADEEKSNQLFWDKFYKAHKDLKPFDDFVESQARKYYQDLVAAEKEGGEKKIIEVLAEKVREKITITPPQPKESNPGVVLEGAPQSSIQPTETTTPVEKVPTMSDLIKKRRAAKIHKIAHAAK